MYQPSGIRTLKKLSEAQKLTALDASSLVDAISSSSDDTSEDSRSLDQQQDLRPPTTMGEVQLAMAAGHLTDSESAKKTHKMTGLASGSSSNNQSETTAEELMNRTGQSFRSSLS